MVVDIAPQDRIGTSTGLYYFFSTLAAILGPWLGGALGDFTGRNYAMFFTIAPLGMLAAFLLKPGERAVSLEITTPRAPIWKDVFGIYFDHVMPRIGGWLSGKPDAYRYLPQSVRAFYKPEQVGELMRAVGFRQVLFRWLMLGTLAVYVGVK